MSVRTKAAGPDGTGVAGGSGPALGAGVQRRVRTVIVGASGRMGRSLLRLLPECPGLALAGAVASAGSAALGQDAAALAGAAPCGVRVVAELAPLLGAADLVIDFSDARAAGANLAACASAGVPLLIGTTGLAAEIEPAIQTASASIALLIAANTSLGVNLLLELVRQAAQALPEFDIEILEAHHRHKIDAPSGTALALGQAAASGRGVGLAQQATYARHGQIGARPPGQIGFAVLRGGDVVGEHEVLFLGDGERVALQHQATDRGIFARGALRAGYWLAAQPPGRYAMRDVFLNKNR